MITACDRPTRHAGINGILRIAVGALALFLAIPAAHGLRSPLPETGAGSGISKGAAESCARKVKQLEKFSARTGNRGTQATRISEEELNSYLAYQLSSKYHPSLKSLMVHVEPTQLQGVAAVDFDQLGMSSKKFVTKMIASLFTGSHTLTVRGKLIADGGRAHFQLERALFDDMSLPNLLVEEIISTVGKRQKPPFDPMQPSQMPYGIQKAAMAQGYIIVYQ